MRLIDADALEERLADKYNGCAGECECCKHYLREKWEKGWCGLIAQAPTIGGWISVKDRLPPNDDTKVLTYGDPVTHWMPLPTPPKEVSGDG